MWVEYLFNIWSIFGLSVVAGSLAGYLWAIQPKYLSNYRSYSSNNQTPAGIRARARFFHERVTHFKEQVRTLDQHANEYASIFSGEEWSNLTATLAHLEAVDQRIQELVSTRNYGEAQEALIHLTSKSEPSMDAIERDLDSYTQSCAASGANSAHWESTIRCMLKKVVSNIETATEEAKQLSAPDSSRKRRPTLVTLADVKKTLLEDDAFSRESTPYSE